MIDRFVILLKPYNCQDVINIPDFRDAATVGKAKDKELLQIYSSRGSQKKRCSAKVGRNIKSQRQRSRFTSSTPKKSLTESKRQSISERKLKLPRPTLKINRWKNTSLQSSLRYVDSDSSPTTEDSSDATGTQDRHAIFPSPPRRRHFKDLQPTNNDLLDLIPPDTDDLELNILPDTNNDDHDESDYDTVSCSSSDGSFYASDEVIRSSGQKQNMGPVGKPGHKLDMQLLGPPSKDVIAKLPQSEIYKCKAIDCGFTTSSSTNIKMHTCAQSRRIASLSPD